MYITRVLYPIEVLGPGKRVGIWFSGCPRRCPGCSNPELWEQEERYKTTADSVMKLINMIAKNNRIDGFTLTGGDPMYQQDALRELLPHLKRISDDLLVYTGYKIEDLPDSILDGISVLIDGEYIESRNTGLPLRGSDNQRIHILDKSVTEKYFHYEKSGIGGIQNFMSNDGVISVGIHKPGFKF